MQDRPGSSVSAVPSERLLHKIDTLFFLRFLVTESFLHRRGKLNGEYPKFGRCSSHNRIPNRSTKIRTLLQIGECEQPLAHRNWFQ